MNGSTSLVAALAALRLAIEVGLSATLLVALLLYVVAAWTWRDDGHARVIRD